jgi:hypothetical protein
MYGPATAGTFAYVCTVIDRKRHTVGQGRGVAELREPGMLNANKTVKMAQKRAQIDAVLRCAGLSQWLTQDLEEPPYVAPAAGGAPDTTSSSETGARIPAQRCTPAQIKDIRALLKMARRHEVEVVQHYNLRRLEELSAAMAARLIERLEGLAYARR